MASAISAAFSLCQLVYNRLEQTKNNETGLHGLKTRVGQLLGALEQSQHSMDIVGGTLDLGELHHCLDAVKLIADRNLEKGGLLKFGKAGDIEAAIAKANKELDYQLAAFSLSALTYVVADTTSIKHGQNALVNEVANLAALVEKLRIAQDQKISKTLTTTANPQQARQYSAPTSNPTRLPSPRERSGQGVPSKIKFGLPTKAYFEFSNHAPYPIFYNKNSYITASHLYAAFRFFESHPAVLSTIHNTASPVAVLSLAKKLKALARKDWSEVAVNVMDFVIAQKFEQHPKLTKLLLGTGEAELVYDDEDPFWGCGKDGKGINAFGTSLMRVRLALIELPIFFNDSTNSHSSFTMTTLHPVTYQGKQYLTCQHLYQSLKFASVDKSLVDAIEKMVDPSEVFQFAKLHQKSCRPDWYSINIPMMETCFAAKFEQYPHLMEELLVTGNRKLIYYLEWDEFWGIDKGHGRNELGKVLQRLRFRFAGRPK